MPASYYITHLNTARNSQTKKPSATFSATMRNLPSLFIDVTPIFLYLAGSILGAPFLLLHEHLRQLIRHARNLRPPQRALPIRGRPTRGAPRFETQSHATGRTER